MRISDWSSDVCSSDLLGEIHAAEIKPGELVESEAKTLLGLGLAPGLGKLRAALFLQDAGQLGFKAAVNLLLGQADAEEARGRSEEHTSELQSLMRISYAVFCLNKKKIQTEIQQVYTTL